MSGDIHSDLESIRKPDPTLGRKSPEQSAAQSISPEEPAAEQFPGKVRRQRVVLAEPSRATPSLMARVELAEQTSWGELLIKDLIKMQLRTGVLFAVCTLLLLGALPAVFHWSPTMANLRVIGLPIPWLLLGIAPFPLLLGVGLWYNQLVERNERDFVDMIEN